MLSQKLDSISNECIEKYLKCFGKSHKNHSKFHYFEMLILFAAFSLSALNDNQPLITQELVDKVNNDPHSSFRARLNPRFAKMTIGQAKKFLSPVRKIPVNHGSARPVGADENAFKLYDKRMIVGLSNPEHKPDDVTLKPVIYDNSNFCSSWATAVTSAMSLALSIHSKKFINLSIQFILDCDLMGDPCIERPPLNAYEPFWQRFIPQTQRWDQPDLKNGKPHFLRSPPKELTKEICDSQLSTDCYPGWNKCPKNRVLSGECTPGKDDSNCPIYFLYNWKWIKSHLWEVGPVTSSIIARQSLFAYDSGVYSSIGTYQPGDEAQPTYSEIVGMLDVTIIGWGQIENELNETAFNQTHNRWWYVIPHFGKDFGEPCEVIFTADELTEYDCPSGSRSGVMRFNRRFDDSNIESQAVGAVPFNFQPKPYRTPRPTWKRYQE
ncbi:hypothetical protein TRFO_12432 [Tritrichomonas foetus]|uniref:Peptidase C1A papain C-terminal domain-containing protein n=3 Tax=Tritrichomonas foetus TaxID=1144522 RepID=A0A1J4L1I7_9EUKA|nr:hypothetical protein TRFO_12432 [Tritrichomonas foetus]|eukprot:OHT17299.1 hypothetical protein TRFO_12432 [Tritrichomonas foetus]